MFQQDYSLRGRTTRERRKKIFKVAKIILASFLLLIITGILFIKYDTAAAAQFTDTVLRPILGADRTIALEKVFFNAEDAVKQKTVNQDKLTAPSFTGQTNTNTQQNIAGHFDAEPIPLTAGFKTLPGEGIWQIRPLKAFPNTPAMIDTFTRPDPARPYAITTIVQLDMTKFNIGSVAGTQQPGGPVGKPGPGIVPSSIINSGKLTAAFDGGFQYRDGAYGMIVGNTTYLPLENNVGTFIGHTDGSLEIINYTGQSLGSNITFIRQNCPILVENGQIAMKDPQNKSLWGRTLTSGIYTWRSGIGLTKNGNLLFAVGNNLTPDTLATALQSAGAVSAIQLDINPSWVRFNIFESIGGGKYSSVPLTKDLKDGSTQYLHGYNKDFFYIYQK